MGCQACCCCHTASLSCSCHHCGPTVAALRAQAGKLEKTIKSEVPPEKNDGPVVVLTAKTFNDIVFGKPRNVLIEFYAPWCVPSHP